MAKNNMQAMGRPKKVRPTTDKLIEAIEKSCNNLSVVAKMYNVSRVIVYRWINEIPEDVAKIEKARNTASEMFLDIAENMLLNNIKKGKETSIIYALNTRGRERGYGNRTEHTIKKDDTIEIGFLSDENAD